mmetsp:Transcript_16137/g.30385  ORF Transcript_16137/g.30385 Transcript_16137/m.30385 type:complete len:204 (-) Transcript_16137:906-1517(-)
MAIAVSINLPQELCNDSGTERVFHLVVAQHHLQLILGNLAISIPVEDTECRPADVLLDVLSPVQGCSQELRVINHSASISINVLHDGLQVWRDLLQAGLLQAFLELGWSQQAITVLVQTHEGVAEGLDLVLIQLARDDVQGGLLELVLRTESSQVVDEVGLQGHVRGFRRLVLDPLVVQRLLGGVAVLRVHLQQVTDQGLGIL